MSAEIVKWSGIWNKEGEWRAGVRLADGRDALLTAQLVDSEDGEMVEYGLIIQGEDSHMDVDVPDDLHERISGRILEHRKKQPVMGIRDLKLF